MLCARHARQRMRMQGGARVCNLQEIYRLYKSASQAFAKLSIKLLKVKRSTAGCTLMSSTAAQYRVSTSGSISVSFFHPGPNRPSRLPSSVSCAVCRGQLALRAAAP